MRLLDDKVAIVTGGGGGIGRSHALLFAEHGATVLVNDTGGEVDGRGGGDAADRVAEEIRAAGGKAAANRESVATFEGAARIVQAAVDAFGGVDIMVNNAGILRDRTLLKTTPEEWHAVLDVHLTGTFACMQAAARQMVAQGRGGRIINTSSVAGLLGNFGQSNYGAAKAGIYALTRTAALELAKHRITVNALAPNAVTRMTKELAPAGGFTEAESGPQYMSPIVCFLASDQAAHITGHTFGAFENQIYVYRMLHSEGVNRKGGAPWNPAEIGSLIQRVMEW